MFRFNNTILFLIALFFLSVGEGNAKEQLWDSSSLASENVLNSNVSAPDIPVELGLIVPWNSVTDPPVFSAGGKYPKWADCDGHSIAGSDLCAERGICSTPNFTDKFLRASLNNINTTYEDSLRSHNHDQPSHTHAWHGELASTAVSGNVNNSGVQGTAAGQSYGDWKTVTAHGSGISNYVSWVAVRTGDGVSLSVGKGQISATDVQRTARPSAVTAKLNDTSVSAHVNNGKVNGSNSAAGDDPTYFTSTYGATQASTVNQNYATETAPKHIRVRYLMRINR